MRKQDMELGSVKDRMRDEKKEALLMSHLSDYSLLKNDQLHRCLTVCRSRCILECMQYL